MWRMAPRTWLNFTSRNCASVSSSYSNSSVFGWQQQNQRKLESTHTHICLTALCPVSRYQKGIKPIWISLKQETVSGSGISWDTCKSAPRSRQITTPAPHSSVFYRPDALPAAQPTASKHWRHNVTTTMYLFLISRKSIQKFLGYSGKEEMENTSQSVLETISIESKCHQFLWLYTHMKLLNRFLQFHVIYQLSKTSNKWERMISNIASVCNNLDKRHDNNKNWWSY